MRKKTEYGLYSEVLNKMVSGTYHFHTKEAAEICIQNNLKKATAFKWKVVSREVIYGDWK